MTTAAALSALFFAGECFFGGSLVLAVAWLLARGRAAAMRHLVWAGAFAALLAIPLVGLAVTPQYGLPWLPAEQEPEIAGDAVTIPLHMEVAPPPAAPAVGPVEIVEAVAAVWLAGAGFLLAKLVAGWIGLVLLHRRSVPHIPEGIDVRPFAVEAPRWQVRLRTQPGDAGAMTWGILSSVVLLPKASVKWPRQRLEAVLLHEFAHVRRRDSLARLVAAIACALYWPNPFAWSAARLMRRDAEMAADDAVLSSGIKASSYAEQLLDLAARGPSFAGVSLSMAEPSTLQARVQSVLGSHLPRSGVTKMDVLKVAVLGLAATGAFAFARPCLAEESAPKQNQIDSLKVQADEVVVHRDAAVRAPKNLVVRAEADRSGRAVIHIADAGAPPPPPAPPESDIAPPAPPAPPAPAIDMAPPAPPAMPAGNADLARLHHAMALHAAEMKKAQAEIAKAQAEIQKALANAKIDETVAQALKDAQPALEQARRVNAEMVKQALAQAHIQEKVHAAMERAKPEIEKAMAQARKAAEEAEERDSDDNNQDDE